MKKFKKIMLVGMMALAALIGFQSSSNALTLGFWDYNPANPITYVQDNSGADLNSDVGVILVSRAIGLWTVNVITGISYPALGSADAPEIDLSSVSVTSTGGGRLVVGVVENDYTGPMSGEFAGPFDFMVGGTTAGTATFKAFGNAMNNEVFNGNQIIIASLGSFGAGAFSGTTSGSFESGSPFALGIVGYFTHSGQGISSFDAKLTAVPEPSVILLMGVGLIGIWGFRKKFKK